MPIDPNARNALKEENQLLGKLIDMIPAGDPWGSFLGRWKANNQRLIDNSDDAKVQLELNEEISRLNGMLESIKGDSEGAKFWKNSLSDDIKSTEALL